MRGQATPIQHEHQKGTPKSTQTMIMPQGQGFLPTSRPSSISGRLDHPWLHWGWARTSRMIIDHSKHLEASRHIFSSQCNQNRHQAKKPMQTFISPRILFPNLQALKRSEASQGQRPSPVVRRPSPNQKWWS